jgi:hypothetical protein
MWKGRGEAGDQLAPPTVSQIGQDVSAPLNLSQFFTGQLSEITGIYPAQLGESKAQESGVAIQLKQFASSGLYQGMIDNLKASIQAAGKVVLDMCRARLVEEGEVQTLTPDGQTRIVAVSEMLDFDSFDFVVSVGKSYDTDQDEIVEKVVALAPTMPQAIADTADIILAELMPTKADALKQRIYGAMLKRGQINPDTDTSMIDPAVAQDIMTKAEEKAAADAKTIADLNAQVEALKVQVSNNQETALAKAHLDSTAKIQVADIQQTHADKREIYKGLLAQLLQDKEFKQDVAKMLMQDINNSKDHMRASADKQLDSIIETARNNTEEAL